ncbi:terminase small subunit [Methylobacterium sp. E-041]|uniref:terminase small subunit n=1 Tax=Methylobacterium sp. E-041 TaxID=2836573 RepID=UPI001FBB6C48|nr:terminase small subunit [Methylobacterium sp. E-041]MCJ2108040.1 terminase small subunit [Methylobacterium sp. E-041]
MEVSTADLAEILGVSARRIQQLAGSGILRKLGHGEWLLPECVQAFVEHKVQSEIRRTSKGEANGADRLKEIKARREELKLAREERELVPLVDAIFAMDQVAGVVVLQINNVPARFTRDLDERERLQAEIDDVLKSVASRIQKCAAALRADLDADPPDGEDDA